MRNDVKIKIFAVLGAYFCLASESQARTLSTLFYLEMKHDGCYWIKQDVVGLKKKELHRTKDCPEEIVWDSKQKRVVYSQNKTIFQADHKKMDNPKAIGLIPGNVADFMLVITASGEVRTATMELLKESEVQKQIIGNDTRYTYVSGKEKLEALNFFEEGQFYKADVHRYIGGKAQKIASYLTKWGSMGTYGLTVARRDMIPGPKTVNLTSEMMKYIVMNKSESTSIASWNAAEKKRALGLLEIKGEYEKIEFEVPEFLATNKSDDGILIKSDFGDSRHFVPPAYFCWTRCSRSQKIDLDFNQISLMRQNNFILFAQEYTNDNAVVFDVKTAKKILDLKGAKSVIWKKFDEN